MLMSNGRISSNFNASHLFETSRKKDDLLARSNNSHQKEFKSPVMYNQGEKFGLKKSTITDRWFLVSSIFITVILHFWKEDIPVAFNSSS